MSALDAQAELHPIHGVAACVEAVSQALDLAPSGPIPALILACSR
jgi:hypothetical protein